MVDAKRPLGMGMPEGHFILYGVYSGHAGLSSNSGVLRNVCPIHCINTFPYYRSMFKWGELLS